MKICQPLTAEQQEWVQNNAGLVRYVVKTRFAKFPRRIDREDLFQYGMLGLMVASQDPFIRKQMDNRNAAHQRIYWTIIDGVRKLDPAPRRNYKKGGPLTIQLDEQWDSFESYSDKNLDQVDNKEELEFHFRILCRKKQRAVFRLKALGYDGAEISKMLGIKQARQDYLTFSGMKDMREAALSVA